MHLKTRYDFNQARLVHTISRERCLDDLGQTACCLPDALSAPVYRIQFVMTHDNLRIKLANYSSQILKPQSLTSQPAESLMDAPTADRR